MADGRTAELASQLLMRGLDKGLTDRRQIAGADVVLGSKSRICRTRQLVSNEENVVEIIELIIMSSFFHSL